MEDFKETEEQAEFDGPLPESVVEDAVEAVVEDSVEVVVDEEYKAMAEDMGRKIDTVSHRAMTLENGPIDEKARTAMIILSSEEPVERSFGNEVLEHTSEAIDMSFIASGRAPLLLDHDPTKQIGVIESIELDSETRRLRAKVRFGRNGLAAAAFDDCVDGIKANISVGYSINKLEKRGQDTYVAKSWRPVEASLVAIPADPGCAIGRSKGNPQTENPHIEVITMSEENVVDVAAVRSEARKAEQKNAAQIVELGSRHNKSDLAQRAISEGRSIEEFRGELLDVIGSQKALESNDIGLSDKEAKRFSLLRAINALANPNDRRAQENAKFEFECSRAASEQSGRSAQGIMLPSDVLRNWKRDMNTTDEAALFSDDYRGDEFIDVLRNSSSVMQAGARMLSGLSGDVKIPKKATASASSWVTEGNPVSESEMTTSSISMTPRHLGAFTDITRQLLQQSSLSVESLVRDDLAQAIALAIDLGALQGDGTGGAPTGIKNASGINVVDFGVGITVPSFAQVVEMETKVAEDNALSGNLSYIMNAAMVGALKTTEKATGTAQFVVEPGGTVNGYRAILSNQAASGDAFFGNFNDLLIGFWSGLDILVDPYAGATSGNVRIIAMQTCDVAVRHAVSFCLGQDVI